MPVEKYDPANHPRLAQAMRGHGMTADEVADAMGVARSTFYQWQKDHPEFAAAVGEGKAVLAAKLESALYKKAMGGYETKVTEITTDDEGNARRHVKKVEQAPDTGALVFALKNLDPENWQDKRTVDTGKDAGKLISETLGKMYGRADG